MDDLPLAPHSRNPLRRLTDWNAKLSISDRAGIATTILSVVAIVVSLRVFAVQEANQNESDQRQEIYNRQQTKLTKASNDLLYSVNRLLNGEQQRLERVATDLDLAHRTLAQMEAEAQDQADALKGADAALRDLKAHAQEQVAILKQEDSALQDAAGAAKAQYRADKNIASLTAQEYGLQDREYKAQVARENARPNLDFTLSYHARLRAFTAPWDLIKRHVTLAFQMDPEGANHTFAITVRNTGDGVLRSATFLISEDGDDSTQLLQGPSCQSLTIHVIQCGAARDLPLGRHYDVLFGISAPNAPTKIHLRITAESETGEDRNSDISQDMNVVLLPPPPQPTPPPSPSP